MTGKLPPDTEKPVPETAAAPTVTAPVPVEVNVTDLVTAESTVTLPKEMLLVLMLSTGIAAFNCSTKPWELLPTVAVKVTACAVPTEAMAAVKVLLLAPDGTFTEAGTETERLLAERPTFTPPLGAAPLSVTVQASESDPVIDDLLQEKPVNVGMVMVPVPPRLITAEGLLDELLLMVS